MLHLIPLFIMPTVILPCSVNQKSMLSLVVFTKFLVHSFFEQFYCDSCYGLLITSAWIPENPL